MSASILYEPKGSEKRLDVGLPSAFLAAMERAGMLLPCRINENDLPVLRGMAAAYGKPNNPYDELISLIEKYESIRIWAEY